MYQELLFFNLYQKLKGHLGQRKDVFCFTL